MAATAPVALAALSRRRLDLTVRTPRELLVPLLTPLLFAIVIAPALREALHTGAAYEAYVVVGTLGLLVPLTAMLSGVGAIVDREAGARRELLAAPIPRPLLVLANLAVALGVTALQVVALLLAAWARGIDLAPSAAGLLWFTAAAALLATGMYAVAEALASTVHGQEEYTARLPVVAIVPWFLAGSLFPIGALPAFLTGVAWFLPLTHALALMRYGMLGDASGLRDVWGMSSTAEMAALSLLALGAFAAVAGALAVRVFLRRAVS